MTGFRLLLVCSLALPVVAAPVCVTDTLDNYIALGSGGCDLGPFTLKDFSFAATSFSSLAVVIDDSAVTVTPSVGGSGPSLNFASGSFTVSGTDFVVYELDYTWDPGDITSLEDVLNAFSPVPPGIVTITTMGCLNAAYVGIVCPTSEVSITVFDDGTPGSVTFASVPLSGVTTLGIRNIIDLHANGASADFASFSNTVTPEPAQTAGIAAALVCLAFIRYRLARTRRSGA